MKKYVVETYYTCTFKTVHTLNNLDDSELSKIDNRSDGEVELIDVKLNNRKTKKLGEKKIKTKTAKSDDVLITILLNKRSIKIKFKKIRLNLKLKNNSRFKMPDRRKRVYSKSTNR